MAVEEESQRLEPLERVPSPRHVASQADLQQGDRALRLAFQDHPVLDQHRRPHSDRPERHRIGGLELATDPVDPHARLQSRPPRDQLAGNQLGRIGGPLKLDDRQRGDGPLVVRVNHRQQRVGNLRVLVVELLADPRRQQRECLDHPFDVRILAPARLQRQQAGHLGIRLRELVSQVPEEHQLAVVIVEEFVGDVHGRSCPRRARASPMTCPNMSGQSIPDPSPSIGRSGPRERSGPRPSIVADGPRRTRVEEPGIRTPPGRSWSRAPARCRRPPTGASASALARPRSDNAPGGDRRSTPAL